MKCNNFSLVKTTLVLGTVLAIMIYRRGQRIVAGLVQVLFVIMIFLGPIIET